MLRFLSQHLQPKGSACSVFHYSIHHQGGQHAPKFGCSLYSLPLARSGFASLTFEVRPLLRRDLRYRSGLDLAFRKPIRSPSSEHGWFMGVVTFSLPKTLRDSLWRSDRSGLAGCCASASRGMPHLWRLLPGRNRCRTGFGQRERGW